MVTVKPMGSRLPYTSKNLFLQARLASTIDQGHDEELAQALQEECLEASALCVRAVVSKE